MVGTRQSWWASAGVAAGAAGPAGSGSSPSMHSVSRGTSVVHSTALTRAVRNAGSDQVPEEWPMLL